MVYAGGGGRFQVVAADGAMDQQPDLSAVQAGRLDGLLSTLDTLFAGQRPGAPEPPLADACHQFQPALGQTQSLIQRLQAAFDLVAAHDLLGQRVPQGFQADILVTHLRH